MRVPKETIKKFRLMWKEEFGEEVPEDYAITRFYALVNLLRIITKKKSPKVDEREKIPPMETPPHSLSSKHKKKQPKLF